MIRNLPVAVPTTSANGIPLIPSEAFCGFGEETPSDLYIEEFYHVKEFKDADFLIRVKGSSMYPKYSSGDMIACKIVHEALYFQWNKIYAISTHSQGIMVKRINKSNIEGCVLLVSDNAKYEPFDIPVADIDKIALVIGAIRLE